MHLTSSRLVKGSVCVCAAICLLCHHSISLLRTQAELELVDGSCDTASAQAATFRPDLGQSDSLCPLCAG